jgi:ubiquinone/menaquinone biosynthesis C-methylase UbiE
MESEALNDNTYVLDPESPTEMARLINLDRVMTSAMGGPFSGVPRLPEEAKVLDLACGPGSWVLDVAFEHPNFEVAGVDISSTMIGYANARARTQNLPNASFGVMDITQPLDFSDNTFDLLNARLLVAVLHREAWAPFLEECTRILKPGGILRLTEPVDAAGITTSASYERWGQFSYQALWRAGYGFSTNGNTLGITTVLPRMLRKLKYQNVHNLAHTLEFSAGSDAWQDFYHNAQVLYNTAPPFFIKAGVTTQEEIDQLYQQMLIEWLSDEFCGMWHFVTAVGEKP